VYARSPFERAGLDMMNGTMSDDTYVRGLVLRTVQILVSHPKAVVVESDRETNTVTFLISVDPRDMANLGGNDGSTAHSLNIIVGAIGRKLGQSMSVEIDRHRR
jgi:predicted RNA-binding protein YlqC (UPF0109 family)